MNNAIIVTKEKRKKNPQNILSLVFDGYFQKLSFNTRNFNRFIQTLIASCNVFWECFSFTDKWQSPKALLEAYFFLLTSAFLIREKEKKSGIQVGV